MERKTFKATEGLLNDVMRKQAGTVEKALLEAVMNSVDANATEIDIEVEDDIIVIEDDGEGMTREEVESYFEKFGLKDDDVEEKDFGKFRMGRGQIFSFGRNIWHSNNNVMVVDLDHEETQVMVDGKEHHLDTSGLSYNLLESEDSYDGCSITVNLYRNLENVASTIADFKELVKYIPWMHDIEITVNDESIGEEFDPDHESEVAYYSIGSSGWSTKTSVYNQGAYVKDEDLNQTGGVIISKPDLEVNFARNDILSGDGNWAKMKEEFQWITIDHLLDEDSLSKKERKWLLSEARDDEEVEQKIYNKELLEDVQGNLWSMAQLDGEDISFSRVGDTAAEDIMDRTGIVFLDEEMEDDIETIAEGSKVLQYEEVIDEKTRWDFEEIDEGDLTKKRARNLARTRWFLEYVGCNDRVQPGYSRHAEVWKDSSGTLYVSKDLLGKKKDFFLTKGLMDILEIAAHKGDTRRGIDHDFSFKENWWKYGKKAGEALQKINSGQANIDSV